MATAADILYLARKERGLSQTELAWLSGVRQPKISAYGRGEVVPKYDVLERLVGHCGLRLAVRLEDNSYPTLPAGPGVWRLKELQWAVSRSPRSFGVLDVRAVPPKGWEEMTVLVRLGSGASGSSVPEGLVEHLRRAVGRVAVVAVGHGATPEAFATAVQVAFVGRTRPPRETRFAPPRADDRWYGTRLVGAGPGRLYGKPRPQRRAWLDERVWSYQRAREAEEKALAAEHAARAEDEERWRELDRRLGLPGPG